MKLLIYSHSFVPSIGGVEAIVLSLARGLAEFRTPANENAFDVTVVTHARAGDFDDRSLGFRVVRQPSLQELWRLIRVSNVVHSAGPALAPLFLARLARKPIVLEHHGYQAICPNGVLVHQPSGSICPGHFQAGHYWECLQCQRCQVSGPRSLASLLLAFPRFWLTRNVAMNIAVTRHVLKRQEWPRAAVVYHGIEDLSPKDGVSPFTENSSNKICFAYVGRFVPEKGIPILLQAARILVREGHEFEVRLIGGGPERAKLEAIIRQERLENRVRITGYLAGSALADALRDVRVVVMPSVWEETAGLAAMEQMMRGRLVITSDVGGLGEIVGDAGLKCAPGDAGALADCMRAVLQNTSIVDTYGRKARERALHLFARERMLGEHASVYQEVLSRRKADAP
jgi:glycogen(starch) synthase